MVARSSTSFNVQPFALTESGSDAIRRDRPASLRRLCPALAGRKGGIDRRSTWGLRLRFNPASTPALTLRRRLAVTVVGMTLTDYLINCLFVLVVLRQTRERPLDARSVIAPLALVVFVATHYVRSIPTGGGDLALLAGLTAWGLRLVCSAGSPRTSGSIGAACRSRRSAGWPACCWWPASAPGCCSSSRCTTAPDRRSVPSALCTTSVPPPGRWHWSPWRFVRCRPASGSCTCAVIGSR